MIDTPKGLVSPTTATERVAASMAKRKKSERNFQLFGRSAIAVALAFLVVLFSVVCCFGPMRLFVVCFVLCVLCVVRCAGLRFACCRLICCYVMCACCLLMCWLGRPFSTFHCYVLHQKI